MIVRFQKILQSIARPVAAGLVALLLPAAQAEAQNWQQRSINVDGVKRTYTVVLPSNPGARKAWPVLFAFHPAIAQGRYMRVQAKIHQAPGASDYVIVYPDGLYRTWNAGDCCGEAYRNGVDDLRFFNAMRQDIGSIVPIMKKTYLTGFSNGARFVYHIMCNQPDTVAAAVTVGATRNMENCRGGRVPLIHIHGDSDEGSPVEGGYAADESDSFIAQSIAKRIGYMEPAAKVVQTVARRNGCSTGQTQKIRKRTLGTSCTAYTSCPGGAVAMLCVVPKLGHAWPGAPSGIKMFGPYRPDLRASAELIGFFNQYR